jgi:hypothetical protein
MKSSGIVAALLIVGVFVPVAWYQGRPAPVEPEVGEPRTQNIFTLAPGDCFEAGSADVLGDIVPIICEERHTHELYAMTRSIADDYDEASIASEANGFCVDMFHRYTGTAFGDSELEVIHLIPTQESWDSGIDRIGCALFDPAGPSTTSMREG